MFSNFACLHCYLKPKYLTSCFFEYIIHINLMVIKLNINSKNRIVQSLFEDFIRYKWKLFTTDKTNLRLFLKQNSNLKKNACFTVITGRCRIGKTELLKHFITDKKSAYLFTTRSAEKVLCGQWQKILEESLDLKIF